MKRGTQSYVFSLCRVCIIILIALLFPRFFVQEKEKSHQSSSASSFKLGLENLSDSFLKNIGKSNDLSYKVGLITNHTGIDQQGRRNIDLLRAKGLNIKKIYIPGSSYDQHDTICKKVDSQTQIPITALPLLLHNRIAYEYAFNEVDVLFFDLQDMGIRPSKCVEVLCTVLKSAANQHKKIIILDRPNLFGDAIEGILNSAEQSEYALPSLPLQYGMTVGELARFINTNILKEAALLQVVPMNDYDRSLSLDSELHQKNILFTNIDLGSGLSFLEALNLIQPLDVGIGTDIPLQCILLPQSIKFSKQKWFELRSILKECGIDSTFYHCFNTYKQQQYYGLRLMIKHSQQFSPFNALLRITQFFSNNGIALSFLPEFDRMIGNKMVREFLQGKVSRESLETEVNKGLKNFFINAQRAFLYKPYPKILFL